MPLNNNSWSFNPSALVRLVKEKRNYFLPTRTTSIILIVTVGAFLLPLPHFSLDSAGRIQNGVIWPYPGETELQLDYEVSSNSTIWWYDQFVEVNISIVATADTSEVGRVYNLTYVLIALDIENVGRVFLVEENLKGSDGIFTNTSIDGTNEVFEYHKSYDIPLDEISDLKRIAPKLHANLDILLEVDWYGHSGSEMTTPLSNFVSGGVEDWFPTPFPILLDNLHYRISGILTYWSFLLSPLLFFLVIVLWKRNRGVDEITRRISFWIIIGLFGIYMAIMLAVTLGPLVSSAWFQLYSVMVTILIGLPISFLIIGLRKIGSEPFSFPDQYPRYVEFCTLTGANCRARMELSDSPLSWNPYKLPMTKYDLVTARILLFVLVIEGSLIFIGSMFQPSTLFIQQISALVLGSTLFGLMKGRNATNTIAEEYNDWDSEWFNVWTLVYDQVIAEESAYNRLGLLEQLRREHRGTDDRNELELICHILNETEASIPGPEIQSRPESIKIGLITWYVREHLKPRAEELANDIEQVLSDVLRPFEEDGIPWRHSLGSEKLLRRVIFTRDALALTSQSPEVVMDFSVLILDDDISEGCTDNIVISRVSTFYNDSRKLPIFPQLHSTSSVLSMLPWWSLFNAVIGLLISGLLIVYI